MTNNPFPVENPIPGWIHFLGSISTKREARPCRRQCPASGINQGLHVSRQCGTHRALPKALPSLSLCGAQSHRRHHSPGHPKTLTSAKPPIQGVHVDVAFTRQANSLRPLRWEVHKVPVYKATCKHLPQDGEFARVCKRELRRARRQCQWLTAGLMQGKISTMRERHWM